MFSNGSVMGVNRRQNEEHTDGGAQPMTPAELTATEYLKMHVYPTLEPVCASPCPPPFRPPFPPASFRPRCCPDAHRSPMRSLWQRVLHGGGGGIADGT